MTRIPILIGLLIFFNLQLWGQKKVKRIKVLPVPTIGYAPETKTYAGAVSLFTIDLYQDSTTRTSNAKVELNYTWNNQIIAEGEWNYFFKEEKWFTKGRIHYSKYPDYYYGIGAYTPESNKLLYNSNRTIVEIFALRNIRKLFFTGPNIKYSNYNRVSYNSELVYPELRNKHILGLGYSILKDTRDNILTSTRGLYVNLNFGYNFLDNHYSELTVDLRYYKTWFEKLTLAARFINESTFGNPPFFEYSMLGGDKYVRGYTYGRYRDKNLSSLQAEFRFPVMWRFGLATFGGVSDLYNNNFWNNENIKTNYGLGLRFLVDKHDKTNLRLDYALGEGNNSGFYISFGESF